MVYCNNCTLPNCVECPKVTLQSLYYRDSTQTVTSLNSPEI